MNTESFFAHAHFLIVSTGVLIVGALKTFRWVREEFEKTVKRKRR